MEPAAKCPRCSARLTEAQVLRLSQSIRGQKGRCTSAQARAAALYVEYKEWCEANGERAISRTAFGRQLAERGFGRDRDRRAT